VSTAALARRTGTAVLAAGTLSLASCGPQPREPLEQRTTAEYAYTHVARLEGRVVSSAGEPLDSVDVGVRLPPGSDWRLITVPALSGPDGRFSVEVRRLAGHAVRIPSPDTITVLARATAVRSKYARSGAGAPATDSAAVRLTFAPTGARPVSTAVEFRLPVR